MIDPTSVTHMFKVKHCQHLQALEGHASPLDFTGFCCEALLSSMHYHIVRIMVVSNLLQVIVRRYGTCADHQVHWDVGDRSQR